MKISEEESNRQKNRFYRRLRKRDKLSGKTKFRREK